MKFILLMLQVFLLVNFVLSDDKTIIKDEKQENDTEVAPEEEKVCRGDKCMSKKDMEKAEKVLKPIFEKMYKKVFRKNSKYQNMDSRLTPGNIMELASQDPELKRELMKATYEIIQNKDMQEILEGLPLMDMDAVSKQNERFKKEIVEVFKLYDIKNEGFITFEDVAVILKSGNDDENNEEYPDPEINYLLNKADSDKSGTIDLKEFTRLITLGEKRKLSGKQIRKSGFNKDTQKIEL